MDQLVEIVFSVPFVGIAVVIALLMAGFNRLGAYLWGLKRPWLRKVLKGIHPLVPVLPALWGAALSFIPWWPVPEPFAGLDHDPKMAAMAVLGLIAGLAWERVWKTFKQSLETRGIKIDIDDHPSKQGK